jgi:hypothetical protein
MIVAALHPAAKVGLSASNTPPSIRSVRHPLPDRRMRTMPPPMAAPFWNRMCFQILYHISNAGKSGL